MKPIALALSALAGLLPANALLAQDAATCAAGKTLEEGVLTVATGNPAYYPWVIDNAPESGQGYEAAVAYAIADAMGFDGDHVTWTRTSFDEAIQPGPKSFDINMQQFSITPERQEMVDFSAPYYSSAMAVLTTRGVVEAGAEPTLDSLKGLVWGAMAGTTAAPVLEQTIAPAKSPLLYGDNADVTAAMQANQIDAALFDLPTALYLAAVMLEDGVVLGQFPADQAEDPDQFGALMEKGSALKPCVDMAIAALTEDGTLAGIEAEWLQDATGVPVVR